MSIEESVESGRRLLDVVTDVEKFQTIRTGLHTCGARERARLHPSRLPARAAPLTLCADSFKSSTGGGNAARVGTHQAELTQIRARYSKYGDQEKGSHE